MKILGLLIASLLVGLASAWAAPQPAAPQAQANFSWTSSTLKPQRWDGKSALPITIYVGPVPARGVRLLPQQLIDGDLNALPKPLQLCVEATGACPSTPFDLSANNSHSLWLRLPDKSPAPPPGTYTGTLRLVSDQDPTGQVMEVTVHVSNAGRQWAGAGLLILGVLLSLVVVRFLRQRAEYLSLKRPLTVLKDEVAALRSAASEHQRAAQLTSFIALLDRLADELRKMGNALPNGWQFWPLPSGGQNPLDNYQAFLEANSSRIAGLSIIFWQGLHPVLLEWREEHEGRRKLVEAAIKDLNALANQPQLNPELARSETDKIVQAMQQQLAQLLEAEGQSFDAPTVRDMTERQLRFELTMVNAAAWIIFALLTSLVGIYALILDRTDFGSPKDLLLCFLWGFGLPTAGEGLAKLTPTSVGQTMGMKVVRGPE